jgi:hypothetical protein
MTPAGTFTMNLNDRTFFIGCHDSTLGIYAHIYVPIGKVVEIKLTRSHHLLPTTQERHREVELTNPDEVWQITNLDIKSLEALFYSQM